MNIFKSKTLSWWQAGVFKISLLSLGILVGTHWSDLFLSYTNLLIGLFIVSTLYLFYIWFRD